MEEQQNIYGDIKTSVLRMAFIGQSGEASHSSLVPPSIAMLPLTLKLNAVGGKTPRVISHPLALCGGLSRLQTSKCKILLLRYRPNGGKKRFVCHSATGVYRLNSHS